MARARYPETGDQVEPDKHADRNVDNVKGARPILKRCPQEERNRERIDCEQKPSEQIWSDTKAFIEPEQDPLDASALSHALNFLINNNSISGL